MTPVMGRLNIAGGGFFLKTRSNWFFSPSEDKLEADYFHKIANTENLLKKINQYYEYPCKTLLTKQTRFKLSS
jgi:hypothetical protein